MSMDSDDGEGQPPVKIPRRARTVLQQRVSVDWHTGNRRPWTADEVPGQEQQQQQSELAELAEVAEALFDLASAAPPSAPPLKRKADRAYAEPNGGGYSQRLQEDSYSKPFAKRSATQARPGGKPSPKLNAQDRAGLAPKLQPGKGPQRPSANGFQPDPGFQRPDGSAYGSAAGRSWPEMQGAHRGSPAGPGPYSSASEAARMQPNNQHPFQASGVPVQQLHPGHFPVPYPQAMPSYMPGMVGAGAGAVGSPWAVPGPGAQQLGGRERSDFGMAGVPPGAGLAAPPHLLRKGGKRSASHVYIAHFINWHVQANRMSKQPVLQGPYGLPQPIVLPAPDRMLDRAGSNGSGAALRNGGAEVKTEPGAASQAVSGIAPQTSGMAFAPPSSLGNGALPISRNPSVSLGLQQQYAQQLQSLAMLGGQPNGFAFMPPGMGPAAFPGGMTPQQAMQLMNAAPLFSNQQQLVAQFAAAMNGGGNGSAHPGFVNGMQRKPEPAPEETKRVPLAAAMNVKEEQQIKPEPAPKVQPVAASQGAQVQGMAMGLSTAPPPSTMAMYAPERMTSMHAQQFQQS